MEFDDEREAEEAVRQRDGEELDGRKIRVKRVRPGVAGTGPRTDHRILVEGLSEATSWQDLKDFFSQGLRSFVSNKYCTLHLLICV